MTMLKIGYKFLVIAMLISTAYAANDEISVGYYEMKNGGGHLSINSNHGEYYFELESYGANGHLCGLEGDIVNTVATLNEDSTSEPCIVKFTQKTPSEIEVSTSTDACRSFCGARAGFEGTYSLPPTSCNLYELESNRNKFLQQYQAHKFASALKTINTIYQDCSDFLNYFEVDKIRNDLAITQYKLGQYSECLSTLDKTLAASSKNEEGFSHLPPSDFENYKPIAAAAWYNQNLCKEGLKRNAKTKP